MTWEKDSLFHVFMNNNIDLIFMLDFYQVHIHGFDNDLGNENLLQTIDGTFLKGVVSENNSYLILGGTDST